jgi:osmotically-inducible protein OsmY
MALAIKLEELLNDGTVRDYADLARLGGVSRARITQIMNLRLLAPDIQEKLIFHERVHSAKDTVKLRDLQAAVRDALWWNMSIDSDTITVVANDGEVRLQGSINGYAARDEAIREARAAGAETVYADLTVHQQATGWF